MALHWVLENHGAVHGDSGGRNQGSDLHLKCPVPSPHVTSSSNYMFCFRRWSSLRRSGCSSKAFFVSPVYHLGTSGKAHADADMIHPAVLFVAHWRYMALVQKEQASWAVFGTLPPVYISWVFPHHWLWRRDSAHRELSLRSPGLTAPVLLPLTTEQFQGTCCHHLSVIPLSDAVATASWLNSRALCGPRSLVFFLPSTHKHGFED